MRVFLFWTSAVLVVIAVAVAGFIYWASCGSLPGSEYASGFMGELPAVADDKSPSDHYTIVTYNIGYCSGLTNNSGENASEQEYSQNVQTILQAMSKVKPDFVAMQEVDFGSSRSWYQDQALLISQGLGLKYRACQYTWDSHYVPWPYGPPSANFGRVLSGQSVLSRYPVVQNTKVTMAKPFENPFWYNLFYLDRIIHVVEVNVDSHPLVILNVHLEAYKRQTREQQAAIVAQKIKEYADKPLILMGDCNARPPEQSPNENTLATILAVEGLHKEFPLEVYSGENKTDYYTSSSKNPVKSIDHIFYNDRIRCLSARVLQDAGSGSDHLPVMMEFVFK